MYDGESTIIMTRRNEIGGLKNTYRLLESLLSSDFEEQFVYSIFMTTEHAGTIEEEFIFDLIRQKEEAVNFIDSIDKGIVTACALREVARDYILASLLFP